MTDHGKQEGLLVAAAEVIGKAAGKIAGLAGGKGESNAPPRPTPVNRAGKLPKKPKARLPRREKKAHKKAHKKTQASN